MALVPTSFLPFWMRPGMDAEAEPAHPWEGLFAFLGASFTAAVYGSLYSPSMAGDWGWYPRLSKPGWMPDPGTMGQIGFIAFFVAAVAGWRIWRTGAFRAIPLTGIGFWAVLLSQASWSTMFYGMQSPLAGMLNLLLTAAIAAVLLPAYISLNRVAAYLWSGYLCWLLFALAVNTSIWRLNA